MELNGIWRSRPGKREIYADINHDHWPISVDQEFRLHYEPSSRCDVPIKKTAWIKSRNGGARKNLDRIEFDDIKVTKCNQLLSLQMPDSIITLITMCNYEFFVIEVANNILMINLITFTLTSIKIGKYKNVLCITLALNSRQISSSPSIHYWSPPNATISILFFHRYKPKTSKRGKYDVSITVQE